MSHTIMTPSGAATVVLPQRAELGTAFLILASANPVVICGPGGRVVGKVAEGEGVKWKLVAAPWWRIWNRQPKWGRS